MEIIRELIQRFVMLIFCYKKQKSYPNPTDIARYVAEAKFFRAYEYFDLLQLFGDVIVVTEPIDITDPKNECPS